MVGIIRQHTLNVNTTTEGTNLNVLCGMQKKKTAGYATVRVDCGSEIVIHRNTSRITQRGHNQRSWNSSEEKRQTGSPVCIRRDKQQRSRTRRWLPTKASLSQRIDKDCKKSCTATREVYHKEEDEAAVRSDGGTLRQDTEGGWAPAEASRITE
ncbi:hypothetical protein LSH36_683g02054 [Paralvinella palmiformis]|uniref:Uncharacterized protein n=1 Tax=Paralvinella palmiformis TaxID=53620 RepID=A0AAD9J3F0_9ANNE|nr:hypothetical protein LSH36_683g02054 [Paralvinella palmiformis]